MVVIDGVAFFRATDDYGTELWRSDGTASGTYRLRDINPGPASSDPTQLTRVGDALFFVADDGDTGEEIWKTDGTPEGTVLVRRPVLRRGQLPAQLPGALRRGHPLPRQGHGRPGAGALAQRRHGAGERFSCATSCPGPTARSPNSWWSRGGQVFFTASTFQGRELWRSDGTFGGTVARCGTFARAARRRTSRSSPPSQDKVFFVADDGPSGLELWSSDGTEAGTVLVRDIVAGGGGAQIGALAALGSTVFFRATQAATGAELWKSDGTETGTVLVKDLRPGFFSSTPDHLAVAGGVLYFEALDAALGRELWRSDGTPAGTFLVADAVPGAGSGGASSITAVGGVRVLRRAHRGGGARALAHRRNRLGERPRPGHPPRVVGRQRPRLWPTSPAGSCSPPTTAPWARSSGAATGPRREPCS